MNTFINLKLLALALQNILDTLSDVLVKCLRFSLILLSVVMLNVIAPLTQLTECT